MLVRCLQDEPADLEGMPVGEQGENLRQHIALGRRRRQIDRGPNRDRFTRVQPVDKPDQAGGRPRVADSAVRG